MTLTFFTNHVHHHQIPLADEFFKHLGHNYRYVEMEKLPECAIKGGYDPSISRSYILRAYESEANMIEAKRLMIESDVVMGVAGPKGYAEQRQKLNKITFNYSERWNKRSLIHALDPRVLYRIYKSFFRFRNKRSYLLCASAFAAKDANFYFCYPNKCYKWGYFTAVSEKLEVETSEQHTHTSRNIPKIMWCSRFLKWKHPELPVMLAARLKREGYDFVINMFGYGEELERCKILSKKLKVEDVVMFRGTLANKEILKEMHQHDIFLFTSDKAEGWGAVLNEAMSQGCAVVASDKIGSVPFLIQDEENGLMFKSEDINSLYEKVKLLIDDSQFRIKISKNAVDTMNNIWNPQNAAIRFLQLVDSIQNNKDTPFTDGPCSKA